MAVRPGDVERLDDPLPLGRRAEARHLLLAGAGQRPARKLGDQRRHAGEIGVAVEAEVDAVPDRLVEQREELRELAAVDLEAEMGVGEVQRHAGAPGDLEALPVAADGVGAVVAVVRTIEAAILGHHLAERHQLVGVGIHRRDVGEPRREPDAALLQPGPEQRLHAVEFGRGREARFVAHHQHAEIAVRHQVGGVHRGVAVEPLKIFADRPPVPVEARRVVVPALELGPKLGSVAASTGA